MEYTRRLCNRTSSSQAASRPLRHRSTSWASASKRSLVGGCECGATQVHFAKHLFKAWRRQSLGRPGESAFTPMVVLEPDQQQTRPTDRSGGHSRRAHRRHHRISSPRHNVRLEAVPGDCPTRLLGLAFCRYLVDVADLCWASDTVGGNAAAPGPNS